MPKKGRGAVDPLKTIAEEGYIGYVEEEEHKADEPGVIWVDIESIHDNPYQHAEDINQDDFQTLVSSIKADGFLGALNVSALDEKGHYYLNGGGHQRRNAARAAGLTKLPVFVTEEPSDRSVLAFRVARENTTRVNTSILNLGYLYQQMIDEFNLTQDEIAHRIGKDRNHVKFALMAVRSAPDIQNMLRQRPDSLRAMTYFRRLERPEDRQPIMERFLAGDLSTEGVRQAVEALLQPPEEKKVEERVSKEEAVSSKVDLPEVEVSEQAQAPVPTVLQPLAHSEVQQKEKMTPDVVPFNVPAQRLPAPASVPAPQQNIEELDIEQKLQKVDTILISTLRLMLDSVTLDDIASEQLEMMLTFTTRWGQTITQLNDRIHAAQQE